MPTDLGNQRHMVEAFGLPIVETHISFVLLGGEFAYKIKKAVKLDFLDFTTLERRRFYCGEELRLNQRLAPALYLDVVPITGSADQPVLEGTGTPIEYAVKMRQFDQDGLLSRVLKRGELTPERVDEIAAVVAAFHRRAAHAAADAPFGRTAGVMRPVRENIEQLLAGISDGEDRAPLEQLRAWTEGEAARLAPAFERRNQHGFVRECHGDLHLGNIALIDGRVTLFDCIEFSPEMRWIDVMSDVAFLSMDLLDHGRPALASRLLNAYLEATGDYEGLAVLRFYIVYRALVRAKIAALTLAQTPGDRKLGRDSKLSDEYRTYLALATAETVPGHRGVFITHGVTGSGKTMRAREIVESAGAIRIRSDVERKRLAGLAAGARTASPVEGGMYSADSSRATYERLAALAGEIVSAGYAVVVDAAFLSRWQRDLLRETAAEHHVPFAIADCAAPESVLRARVKRRLEEGRDASEATIAVLEHQLATAEPLAADEL